jgi:hypothetical protein
MSHIGEALASFFHILHPSEIHSTSMENNWILPPRQYAHLQLVMKHCTKARVCPMSHIGGEALARFCDRQTDWRTESTKTICLPLEEGRHKYYTHVERRKLYKCIHFAYEYTLWNGQGLMLVSYQIWIF